MNLWISYLFMATVFKLQVPHAVSERFLCEPRHKVGLKENMLNIIDEDPAS